MPKVSHIDLKINGNLKRYDIYYNKADMFHIKGLPGELIETTRVLTTHYSTEARLIDTIGGAISEYHRIISSQKKVIAYRIVLPTEFYMNKEDDGVYSGVNRSLPIKLHNKIAGFPFDNHRLGVECGFKLEYEVLYEVNDNGTTYRRISGDGVTMGSNKSIMKYHIIMPWSAEREAFFNMIQDNTKDMIFKMLAFFGKDDTEMLNLIDTGGQKLLS